eukprot:544618-Rhodomonas_salina.2
MTSITRRVLLAVVICSQVGLKSAALRVRRTLSCVTASRPASVCGESDATAKKTIKQDNPANRPVKTRPLILAVASMHLSHLSHTTMKLQHLSPLARMFGGSDDGVRIPTFVPVPYQ